MAIPIVVFHQEKNQREAKEEEEEEDWENERKWDVKTQVEEMKFMGIYVNPILLEN